ncbi:MAG: spoIIAA [Caloramator sp.]|uniref:anti-sigma F factor antagonist n=1 Tax=unclassified Caloramator TaxID=2629145 RepID=UPI0004071B48|nr:MULTISPECIES: anti-sigma F factor antagonist [unclassified Caloramator]MBZ4663205.1 spoIIAA [Caloramator sp.]
MQLKFSVEDGCLIVEMHGELDHHSAEGARIKIDNKIEELGINKLIFDFSGVNFMDSSGIGVIIGRYKKLKDYDGKVAVVNLKPQIKKIFELSGLFKILNEFENTKEALLNL